MTLLLLLKDLVEMCDFPVLTLRSRFDFSADLEVPIKILVLLVGVGEIENGFYPGFNVEVYRILLLGERLSEDIPSYQIVYAFAILRGESGDRVLFYVDLGELIRLGSPKTPRMLSLKAIKSLA